jgi:hypothetical protein
LIPANSDADSRFSRVDSAIGRTITDRRSVGAFVLAAKDGLVAWSDPTTDQDAGLTEPIADRISPQWTAELRVRPTSVLGP